MKTFIRQPGNKSRYLRYIIPLLPTYYNTYYEPFIGTGALFFKIQPDKWVILNTNGEIYNLDYKEIFKKTKKNDFCFIDPPYIEDHDYQFTYNTEKKEKKY